jgi:predicted nucleic acid-binding protein
MPDYLLDSGILICHLRGRAGYLELFNRLMDEAQIHISAMTRLEIARGMREKERETTLALLNSLETLEINAAIADRAGELVRAWRTHGATLEAADALIAATAIHHGLTLFTTNARHFPMPELVVFQVNEFGQISRYKA